jgi:hypothetical protein
MINQTLVKPGLDGRSLYINEMVNVLEKYKSGKKIADEDRHTLDELAMTGYIRYGYEFDQTTFLVTRTAKITAVGEEIIANS